jgi:hypothetical protein
MVPKCFICLRPLSATKYVNILFKIVGAISVMAHRRMPLFGVATEGGYSMNKDTDIR